jgi:hypothetical protein
MNSSDKNSEFYFFFFGLKCETFKRGKKLCDITKLEKKKHEISKQEKKHEIICRKFRKRQNRRQKRKFNMSYNLLR